MNWKADRSLRWNLVRRLLALQAAMLATLCVLIVGGLYWTGSLLTLESEDQVIRILQDALGRGAEGGLVLRTTPELVTLKKKAPGLWFSIRDHAGHSLTEGAIPPEFGRIGREIWMLLREEVVGP